MKTKKMYAVMKLVVEGESTLFGITIRLDHGDMCGMIPVFRTKKAAKKEAGKKYRIAEITEAME